MSVQRDIPTQKYSEQSPHWPVSGRHILAHYDAETIVVYQAYRPEIGEYAIRHGRFGGEFKYSRMSWIKPNFLWMMYRSDWGRAEGQGVVLAVRLTRTFFDSLLASAVHSTFQSSAFADRDEWSAAVATSDVRLQWDPDHLPTGGKCERRAIQLGLRGEALKAYGQREIVEIIDMTSFVHEQRERVRDEGLLTPVEQVYRPEDPRTAIRLGLD